MLQATTTSADVSTIPRPKFGGSAAAQPLHQRQQDEVLIELKNVHKAFGSKKILNGVNITIRRGEAVGIIGGSGTGKSTTLRLMAGLLAPDQVPIPTLLSLASIGLVVVLCYDDCTGHLMRMWHAQKGLPFEQGQWIMEVFLCFLHIAYWIQGQLLIVYS